MCVRLFLLPACPFYEGRCWELCVKVGHKNYIRQFQLWAKFWITLIIKSGISTRVSCHSVLGQWQYFYSQFITYLALQNRSGGTSFRRGQVQVAEKKDSRGSLLEETEKNKNANHSTHCGAVSLDIGNRDKDELSLELGFSLARSIFHQTKEKRGCLSSLGFVGNGEDYGYRNAQTFAGEIKSVSAFLECVHKLIFNFIQKQLYIFCSFLKQLREISRSWGS